MRGPLSMSVLLPFASLALSGSGAAQDAGPVYYFDADWSPDGERIVFSSGHDQKLSIFTIDVDGGNLTRLTDDTYNDEGPVWSPDGKRIAFFSNRRDRRDERPISLQIYVMNSDGTGQRRVTDEGSALDYAITWSPLGDRIAFQSRPEIDPAVHSIYMIGIDGSGRQRLTDGQYNDISPQWSPDGDHILFTRTAALYKFRRDRTAAERRAVNASAEIALLDLADGSVTLLTDNDVPDTGPSWSADGSEVLFFRETANGRKLLRQTRGQAEPTIVVANGESVSSGGFVNRANVSPDGRSLVYAREVDGVYGIYIFDLELEVERRIAGS